MLNCNSPPFDESYLPNKRQKLNPIRNLQVASVQHQLNFTQNQLNQLRLSNSSRDSSSRNSSLGDSGYLRHSQRRKLARTSVDEIEPPRKVIRLSEQLEKLELTDPNQQTPFDRILLQIPVMEQIFQHLDHEEDVYHLAITCKTLYAYEHDHDLIWKTRARRIPCVGCQQPTGPHPSQKYHMKTYSNPHGCLG